MKAAIVDDMVTECTLLCSLLKEYEASEHLPIQVTEFHSGKELLCTYTPGSYDVVFMDIFLNDENGVDCAGKLLHSCAVYTDGRTGGVSHKPDSPCS